MKAHIINIGDEILIGDTINTNASWMASQLNLLGVEVDNNYKDMVIFHYSDGTVKKGFIVK